MNVTAEDLQYAMKDPGAYKVLRGHQDPKSAYLFTICAYYEFVRSKNPEILREAENVLNALLLDPAMNHVQRSNLGNLKFYARSLPDHPALRLLPECNKVAGYEDPLWKSLNPFLVPSGDKDHPLHVGLRVTDFDKKDHHYFSRHGGPIRNYYEMNGRIIEDRTEYTRYPSSYSNGVKGLEDIRMCRTPFGYRGFAVTADAHEEWGPRLSLLTYDPKEHAFKDLHPLTGPGVDNQRAQKNWLPYWDDGFKAITSSDPLIIAEVSENGECKVLVETKEHVPGARGGSPPIVWEVGADGAKTWLYAVHHVHVAEKERFYYHRFIKMRDNRITAVSRIFYLNDIGIEYISGLFIHPKDPNVLYIGYGWKDVEARLMALSRQDVQDLFEPMPFPPKFPPKSNEVDLPNVVQFIPIEGEVESGTLKDVKPEKPEKPVFIPIDLDSDSSFIPI